MFIFLGVDNDPILALESQCLFSEGSIMDEASGWFPWLESVLEFPQCFDTVLGHQRSVKIPVCSFCGTQSVLK